MLQGKQYQNSECTLVWLIARSFLLVDIFLLAPDSTHWTLTNSEEVMPGMVALPTFAHDALVICWLCSLRCLCSPMALRWGSIQLLLEWEKHVKAHTFLQETKEYSHHLPQKSPQPGRGLNRQGCSKGAILALISLLVLPKCASLTPHQCPRGGVTPQPPDAWKVSDTNPFFLRRLFWTDAREISRPTKMGP